MIAGSVVLWFIVLVLTVAAAVFAVLYMAVTVLRVAHRINPWGQVLMSIFLSVMAILGFLLLTGVIGS